MMNSLHSAGAGGGHILARIVEQKFFEVQEAVKRIPEADLRKADPLLGVPADV